MCSVVNSDEKCQVKVIKTAKWKEKLYRKEQRVCTLLDNYSSSQTTPLSRRYILKNQIFPYGT